MSLDIAYYFYSSGKIQIGVFYLHLSTKDRIRERQPVVKVHIDGTLCGVALCREGDSGPRHSLQTSQTLAMLLCLFYHLLLANKITALNHHHLSLDIIMFI